MSHVTQAGTGLPISYTLRFLIVTLHHQHHRASATVGGEIAVYSEGEGKGSSCSFTLPMKVSE